MNFVNIKKYFKNKNINLFLFNLFNNNINNFNKFFYIILY